MSAPQERVLVLSVDRDGDLERKTGTRSPIVGRDAVMSAATSLAVADPEEADANALFAAVKEYDKLRAQDVQCDVGAVCGLEESGFQADRKIRSEVEALLSKQQYSGIVLISDGAEDELVIPIIQTLKPIVSVRRVVVKHSRSVEENYMVLGRYLRMLVFEPRYSKWAIGVPGIILLFAGVLVLAGEATLATFAVLIIIGGAFLVRGFNIDRFVAGMLSQKPYGYIRLFTIPTSILILIVGLSSGYANMTSEAPGLIAEVGNSPSHFFQYGGVLSRLLPAGLAPPRLGGDRRVPGGHAAGPAPSREPEGVEERHGDRRPRAPLLSNGPVQQLPGHGRDEFLGTPADLRLHRAGNGLQRGGHPLPAPKGKASSPHDCDPGPLAVSRGAARPGRGTGPARRAPGVTAVLDDILRSIGVYRLYESNLNSQIEGGPIPGHIGIILDGNRRWAQNHRLTVDLGHTQGADVVERLLDWCHEIGIKSITLYVLSTENLNRSSEEVAELFRLIEERLRRLLNDERIYKYKVRVKGIGKFDLLPPEMREILDEVEKKTASFEGHFLNIAVAYGGRTEITDSVRGIAEDVKKGLLSPDDITEETIAQRLYTSHLPNPEPDLIIRTSGEERMSGFLLWQGAYSELVFLDVYWPAFRKIDLLRAVRIYQRRQRRLGR